MYCTSSELKLLGILQVSFSIILYIIHSRVLSQRPFPNLRNVWGQADKFCLHLNRKWMGYFNEIKNEMCLCQLFSKLHNYFPTKSPCTSIHFHQCCTSFWNLPLKKSIFCFWNHFLTADFTSSSQLRCWPFKCSFSFGNRCKSLGARSGLYGGCGSTEKSRCWIASLVAALV